MSFFLYICETNCMLLIFFPLWLLFFYVCCAHLEYEYHLLFQIIEEKEYMVYYGFVYQIIHFIGFVFEQLSVSSFGRYEHIISHFFHLFNISLCLIHCSIKQFLLMSLLLWISVLSEGLVIVGLLKQKFKSNFGRMGTTKAALYIDYESVL